MARFHEVEAGMIGRLASESDKQYETRLLRFFISR
jgi:hypothetical protein